MVEHPVLEHGTTRRGRWLRHNRTKIAVWIAVAEGLLLVVGVINRWGAVFVALLVIVGYFVLSPRLRPGTTRDVVWIAAVSQAIVALVPVLLIVVGTLSLIAVGVIAVVALVVMFSDRR